MKTRLAILVALAAAAGASVAAEAIDPVVPGNPGALLGPIGAPPVLFPSEQGAFKGLEVAKQLVESYILQNGCGECQWPTEMSHFRPLILSHFSREKLIIQL